MLCIRTRKDKTGDNKVLYVGNDDIELGVESVKKSLLGENRNEGINDIDREDSPLIARKLDVILQKMKENDDDDEIKYEWRIAALTIDRFFFICSTLVLILIIICCFGTAPGYVA